MLCPLSQNLWWPGCFQFKGCVSNAQAFSSDHNAPLVGKTLSHPRNTSKKDLITSHNYTDRLYYTIWLFVLFLVYDSMCHFNNFNICQSFPFSRLYKARLAHLACLAHGQNVQPSSTAAQTARNGTLRKSRIFMIIHVHLELSCVSYSQLVTAASWRSSKARFEPGKSCRESRQSSDLSVPEQMVVPSLAQIHAPSSTKFKQYMAVAQN